MKKIFNLLFNNINFWNKGLIKKIRKINGIYQYAIRGRPVNKFSVMIKISVTAHPPR